MYCMYAALHQLTCRTQVAAKACRALLKSSTKPRRRSATMAGLCRLRAKPLNCPIGPGVFRYRSSGRLPPQDENP